ncbi:MAG: Txe/YoeB family addiction module toxin [Candidatus Ancillula sp.]|jgi:toxin YoeB|nr:Txe/YoeB family addiction module toxin [Candidatus Ancillula sp.]
MLHPVFLGETSKQLKKCKDKKYVKKVLVLVNDACRTPFKGLGKPEPLKENLSGYWSRRIDKKNRLIYRVVEPDLLIVSVVGHY